MYFTAKTLDDLMHPLIGRLLRSRNRVAASRGVTTEINGVLLKLSNPRARLSRSIARGKVFSCLGEFFWYLSKGNRLDFIEYYISRYADDSDDGKTIYGGYGPRLFNCRGKFDQVTNVIDCLRARPSSRRAVIQLFDVEDVFGKRKKEIPCTCTLQFMVRKGRLEMFTSMRSNDAFLGLPHDVFAFTMLQELIARSLSVEIGVYKHAVGSLHLYTESFPDAQQYIDEGFQSTKPMPEMPIGDPWLEIRHLVKLEASLRVGKPLPRTELKKRGYWADLGRLFEVYRLSRGSHRDRVTLVKKRMSSKVFNSYISRREAIRPNQGPPEQMDIVFPGSVTEVTDK